MQHLLEKQVSSSQELCSMRNFLQMDLQEPDFFWFMINVFLKKPVLLKYWLLRSFFYKEATSKSSTKRGLLYAIENPEERELGMLSDQPRLLRVTSTALRCHWQQHSLEDMTSLGTDFEMHAIWQGCAEDPTAKNFVVRKARTLALSKVQGSCHRTSDNQPYL
jgi:hypothetical protein